MLSNANLLAIYFFVLYQQWYSVTNDNYAVAKWRLVSDHFPLLFPKCSQEQQRMLTRFLISSATNGVDSDVGIGFESGYVEHFYNHLDTVARKNK